MAADSRAFQQRRTHNLLLIQKILTLKAETSPFTLVLDTVEQGAGGLVREIVGLAKTSKTHVIYISHSALYAPSGTDTFIKARRKTPEALKQEILGAIPPGQKTLLIIYPLPPSLLSPNIHLPTYLLSLLSPSTSLLVTHHLDIPLPQHLRNTYAPTPLTILRYLATTILTLHSFPQQLAKKNARDHAREEPAFGLAEGREGVIAGLGANAHPIGPGIVMAMEYRRKSGRAVTETFLIPSSSTPTQSSIMAPPIASKGDEGKGIKGIVLLDDHPLFAPPSAPPNKSEKDVGEIGEEDLGGTFNLGLTEKQRRDREGVVLPYYDAQQGNDGGGGGEGGRILYDMGEEDDFDEEEDEI
ncbi:MAG: hypothetical protein Q9209_005861 [Squamulea sp. 1 TL-2023]